MSTYAVEVPNDVQFDPQFRGFFEEFYAISDTPGAHEKYADQFTSDATVIMASKKVQGTSEIIEMRKGMWEKIASRKHAPRRIYPFGPGAHEVMLYGGVDFVMKDGKQASVDWAARAHLVKAEQAVKMDFYQVFLDTQNAAK
ncbi:MAG: hypothetical protein M1821_001853 [Bathelium mastoideum]|nr:MAG: hypothetical protein M1821_001853 [Bathelium mastoideum]KAI9692367.1 MAG: hypothetical protein M1822_006598 [Bathelium mastoideum]